MLIQSRLLLAGLGLLVLQGCATSIVSKQLLQDKTADMAYQQLQLADKAYASSQWSQASASYANLVEQMPENAYFHFRLGNSLAYGGQFHKAIDALSRSVELDASQSKYWLNLSTIHLLAAQHANVKALESIGENDPHQPLAQSRLQVLRSALD
jgi:predicted Zn-dependent protease